MSTTARDLGLRLQKNLAASGGAFSLPAVLQENPVNAVRPPAGKRSSFPPVFWVANIIEVLERFAYYGIYFGFGIYLTHLGYKREQLGAIQSFFLLFSYAIPLISGTFADRFGFKRVLIISYLAYLPSILLLMLTKSFSGIALTMLSIGFAAGIFKPLVAGTIRVTTDTTNKTLGFGIFYAMVNVGGSFGPIVAGKLRAISWNYAFLAAAISIGVMMLVTILFYKEPPRELERESLGKKFRDIGTALADVKFTVFLVLLGVLFWLPFWAFFNLCALYVDSNLDTAQLYQGIRSVLGQSVADFFSRQDKDGTRHILGETISHTGYIIMLLQLVISRLFERIRPMPSFLVGLSIAAAGLAVIGLAGLGTSSLIFLGILLFAVGEMITSPRIQEYITWIAPKEKAGLYMGSNFLATMIGGFTSGLIYTSLYGRWNAAGAPERVWFVLAAHCLVAVAGFWLFVRVAGEFKEQEA
jgi:proton-dependent oligopeptide transporter, POT family